MISPSILVISNESTTLNAVNSALAGDLCALVEFATGADAFQRIQRQPAPALVLFDMGNENGSALPVLRQLRSLNEDLAIVALTSSDNASQVADAIRSGAQACLNLPLRAAELQQTLVRYFGPRMSAGSIIEELGPGEFFVAGTPATRNVRAQAELLANIDVPVLILGESGTGKGVVAHLIHKLSSRSQRRFLKVNCAALPGELLESELFGHERGAFTGAMRTRQGKFELCDKGTILLDEVAEMPANLQAKLLHVLQDQQFFRLGGETTIEVDVRVLASTNVNVNEAITEKKFREDLYYRLSAFTIHLPPLRERQEEIPVLLWHFMNKIAVQYSRPPVAFTAAVVDACLRYAWPGNLRELENFVRRYVVMADEKMALAELHSNGQQFHVPVELPLASVPASRIEAMPGNGELRGTTHLKSTLRSLKDEAEVQAISRALQETQWNRKRAARLLNISYRGLLYKIRQHGITRTGTTVIPHYLPDHRTLR